MPTSVGEWVEVANERAGDARAMVESRNGSCGPTYMAGYAIECSLKALLLSLGRQFPSRGPRGHDLRALWHAADFSCRDLRDPQGDKTYFITQWSTDLRYCKIDPTGRPAEHLVRAAMCLNGWIQTRIRRNGRP